MPVNFSGRKTKWGRRVDIRGQPGAPVLDLNGKLLGIVRTGGRRKAVMLPMKRVMPFLSKAVLGEQR